MAKAVTSNPKSSLKVFRFGSFKPSAVSFENVYKHSFGNSTSLIVGSITVADRYSIELAYNHQLKNNSMFILKFFEKIRRNVNNISPFRCYFNEVALSDGTQMPDLIQLYRATIEEFDDRFSVNVPYKVFKIWIKGKNVDLYNKYIEKEKKESLVARYLIAYA